MEVWQRPRPHRCPWLGRKGALCGFLSAIPFARPVGHSTARHKRASSAGVLMQFSGARKRQQASASVSTRTWIKCPSARRQNKRFKRKIRPLDKRWIGHADNGPNTIGAHEYHPLSEQTPLLSLQRAVALSPPLATPTPLVHQHNRSGSHHWLFLTTQSNHRYERRRRVGLRIIMPSSGFVHVRPNLHTRGL